MPEPHAGVKTRARSAGREPRSAALRLLAIRPRSETELAERLRAKGFPPDAVASVLDGLRAEGLLDDAAVARAVVESALARKAVGRQWLVQKLRQYRVPPAVGERLLAVLLPPERERVLARAAAEQKLRRLRGSLKTDSGQLHARLHRFLRSRGFSGDAIEAALRRTMF